MQRTGRILVVDDDKDTLDLVQLTLSTAGYHVETVPSGKDALRAISEQPYDLVLLDIMMPEISGYDVLRTMRADKNAPPVVILTARTRPEDRQIGERLGAAGFLVKPVTRGNLLDVIQRVLGEFPTPVAGE